MGDFMIDPVFNPGVRPQNRIPYTNPISGQQNLIRKERHIRTGISRELSRFMRTKRKLIRTIDEAQATQRDIIDLEELGQKLESLRKEVDKNASFIIFGQSFAVKAEIAETILGEKLFSGEFNKNSTQITVRITYGKQHNYTFSVSGDTGCYDLVELPGNSPTDHQITYMSPGQMNHIEVRNAGMNSHSQCSRTLEIRTSNEVLRDNVSIILTTTNNMHFTTSEIFDNLTNDTFPIVIYGLEYPKLTSKNKAEIVDVREICSDLQFLFVNFGNSPDSEFTESEQSALWQTMAQDLKEVGIVESLPQAIPEYLLPPKTKEVDKSPVFDGTGSCTPVDNLFGAMGQGNESGNNSEGVSDGTFEELPPTEYLLAPPSERNTENRRDLRTMSIHTSNGNELNVRTNSRLSSIDNFLEQLDLFVREVLRQRTINKSDEAREVLTDLLEECISTTYKFTKDAKLIPVRIKWVKEQEQKLYHALLVVASQKQNEIKTLIRKSLEESRENLVEVAEKHKFHEDFEPSKSTRNQRRELEEIILKELNTIIAKKLVGSVDMLKETLIDTLCRTVETLEKDSPKSDFSSPESSLESSTSTLVTGFSAKHALSEIISAAYQIEISSRNTISLRALLMEQLKRLFVNFNAASENEDDWKRKIAIQMIEKISEEKLAKEVCLQFKANVERAHQEFLTSIDSIQESQLQRMSHQAEKGKKMKKNYSPKLARFVLESTCYRDQALHGMPRFEQEIGRGQYGVVYSCKKWGLMGPCAVKSVAPPDDKHWNGLAMEFYYTKSLPEHNRIVQIRGCVIDSSYSSGNGSAVLLIMDKMKRDLHTAIRQGLPLAHRLQVAVDVVEGLRFLHSRDLVHRDIKLKNVLLDDKDRGKITDLGFSKPQAMMCGSVVGTPIHMAPELFKGGYDCSVDVYAFGILFWYICAGTVRLPQNFEQCSSKENLWSSVQKGCRPERLAAFTDEMWQLMTNCWNPNPHMRLKLGEIQDALFKIKLRETLVGVGSEQNRL